MNDYNKYKFYIEFSDIIIYIFLFFVFLLIIQYRNNIFKNII